MDFGRIFKKNKNNDFFFQGEINRHIANTLTDFYK